MARIYAVVMHVAGLFVTIWCSYVSGGHETAELVCDASLRCVKYVALEKDVTGEFL